MGKRLVKMLRGEIASSAIYILFGLCLIFIPVQTVNVICKVFFGLVLIGSGIFHIYHYMKESEDTTVLDLFTGVIVLIIGGYLFFNPQIVVSLLPYLLGALILIDSIWVLRGCIKLRRQEGIVWKIMLGCSLAFIILGIVIMINPFSGLRFLVIFAGWVFAVNGISDIVFWFLLRKGLKELAQAVEQKEQKEQKEQTDQKVQESSVCEPKQRKQPFWKRKEKENRQEEPAESVGTEMTLPERLEEPDCRPGEAQAEENLPAEEPLEDALPEKEPLKEAPPEKEPLKETLSEEEPSEEETPEEDLSEKELPTGNPFEEKVPEEDTPGEGSPERTFFEKETPDEDETTKKIAEEIAEELSAESALSADAEVGEKTFLEAEEEELPEWPY